MKKFRLFATISDEEKWINSLQAQGYRLTKVSPYTGIYTFEKEENPPIVRLDYRKFDSKQDYIEYLSLFADSGWTLIPGSTRESYQYFMHPNDKENTDIFSDDQSRYALYARVRKQILLFSLIYATNFLVFFQMSFHQENSWNLKELYLTPGLWEMKGATFWFSFLFETPFAFLRSVYPAFIILAAAIFYLYIAYKNRLKGKN